MELVLDSNHPLAKAVQDISFTDQTVKGDVFILVKSPGQPSYFRAVLRSWTRKVSGGGNGPTYQTRIEFDSWEDHIERMAQVAGL